MNLNKILMVFVVSILVLSTSFLIKNHFNKSFYIDVINSYNQKEYVNLNKLVHPKYGILVCGYDGVYPTSYLLGNIDSNINSYLTHSNELLFDNLELGELYYQGNGKFKKDGAFLSSLFSEYVDGLNSPKTPLDEKSFENAKKLESITKFKVKAISKDHKNIFTFYFGVDNNEKYLCAISVERVPDFIYLNNKENISFDNEESIRQFLNEKVFCGLLNRISYINFKTKEIESEIEDRGNASTIIYFDYFTVGEAVNVPPGVIKERPIDFFKNDEMVFSIILTNKGEIFELGTSASGTVSYNICKNEDLLKNNATKPSVEKIVAQIRKNFYSTTSLLNNGKLVIDTLTSEEDYPYRELIYSNSSGEVLLIKQGDMSNACYDVDEYYFTDNKLYFSYAHHKGSTCQIDKPLELRRYIYQDKVVRIIEDKNQIECHTGCEIDSESAPYKTLRKYLSLQGY